MTPSTAAVLDDLSGRMDVPVDEVLTQALGLLILSVRAQERGQRICLTDDDLNVLTEIVNFGIETSTNFETSDLN